jgi:rhodanese-related sulfurtransferase
MTSEISVSDLAALLDQQADVFLLDVRGADEFAYAVIKGAVHIPLDMLIECMLEIPRGRPIITICHHGVRSAQAADFLRQNGYDRVRSLRGGVDAWAQQVDPAMPRY